MRFNHIFKLTNENETHREYKCDNVNINIDFISGSALRVAVFNDNAEMLPTFTVNPNNTLSSLGRSRLSVDGLTAGTARNGMKIKRNLFLIAALPLTSI